jgi:hypothetical protein
MDDTPPVVCKQSCNESALQKPKLEDIISFSLQFSLKFNPVGTNLFPGDESEILRSYSYQRFRGHSWRWRRPWPRWHKTTNLVILIIRSYIRSYCLTSTIYLNVQLARTHSSPNQRRENISSGTSNGETRANMSECKIVIYLGCVWLFNSTSLPPNKLAMIGEQISLPRSNKENYEETYVTTWHETSLISIRISNVSFSLIKTMQDLPKEPNTPLESIWHNSRFRLYSTQLKKVDSLLQYAEVLEL